MIALTSGHFGESRSAAREILGFSQRGAPEGIELRSDQDRTIILRRSPVITRHWVILHAPEKINEANICSD